MLLVNCLKLTDQSPAANQLKGKCVQFIISTYQHIFWKSQGSSKFNIVCCKPPDQRILKYWYHTAHDLLQNIHAKKASTDYQGASRGLPGSTTT